MTRAKSHESDIAVDAGRHVAERLRYHCIMAGLTKTRLAEIVGVSYAQVFRYESGETRIGAGLLFELSQILNVEVTSFFDGLPSVPETDDARVIEPGRPEADLARAWSAIEDPQTRRELWRLVRALAR